MRKFTLITKATLVVSLLVSAGLSAITLYALRYFAREFKETVSQQQLTMVSAMAEEIDSKIATVQNVLISIADNAPAAIAAHPADAQRFLVARPGIRAVFDDKIIILSPAGKVVAASPTTDSLARDLSSREYFKKTMSTGRAVISKPLISALNRRPIIVFTAPIRDPRGRITGILAGSLDLLKDNFLGKLASVKVGHSGYLYLFDSSRTMIVHPHRERITQKDVPPGVNRLYDSALRGFEGTGETVNSKGLRTLASFRRLKGTDWILAANYPLKEAYAPITRARNNILSALFFAIASSILVCRIFMRRLTAPLLLFIRHVDEITENKQQLKPLTITTWDEFGVLVQAFNRMIQEVDGQKRAALAQQEFTQNLMQHAAVPAFVLDRECRVIIWNRACEVLTGVSAGEVIGSSDAWRAFYRQKAPLLAEVALGRALEKGQGEAIPALPEVMKAEAWFEGLNGRDRFLCFNAAPVRGADGTVVAAVQTVQDFTCRRRNEESLRKLSLAIEQAPLSVLITDCTGVIEWVNPHFTAVTGYSAVEAVGSRASLVNSGYHPPAFFAEMWGTIRAGREWRGEIQNRRKNGERYWESVSISPVKDEEGNITHFVAVREEITGRKWAEDALRKSEERIRLLLESTAEAILGIDLQGNCTFANRSGALLLGYRKPEELIGLSVHTLVHSTLPSGPDYFGADCAIYRSLWGEEGIHVDDEVFWRADGTSFSVEYWSYPQREGRKVVGAVVTFFDISERKRAEDELRRAMAAAEAATMAKSEFLANMSHEIRTPMNAFMGMLHLLQQTPLDEKQQNYLGKAQGAAGILLRIINDILDFSKIEAGKLEVEEVPFSLSAVLAYLYDLTVVTLKDKPVHLSVSAAPGLPDRLVGDPLRLGQILLNLTANAVKFTAQGAITVRAEGVAAPEGKVGIRFSVEDTGIGMAYEKQEKLFHAFTQEDSSTTRRFGGTGLGLAICKQLVEMMGGRIWVASEQGKGSTFSFIIHLPEADASEVPVRHPDRLQESVIPSLPSARAPLSGVRILVAEDNQVNQEVAREILTRAGAAVDFADNGAEAVLKVLGEEMHYDVVLMDVHMPVMDGLEAARRMRAERVTLPIIAMTASVLAGDRHLCLEAGMNDQVNKPVDVPRLLATVAHWVKGELPPLAAPLVATEVNSGGFPSVPGIEVKTALKRLGDPQLLVRLLKSFYKENEGTVSSLRHALEFGDLAHAARLVHTVKGVGGNVGAERLAGAALALEEAFPSGSAEAVQRALHHFEEELLFLLAAIRALPEEADPLPMPVEWCGEGAPFDEERALPLFAELAELLEAQNLDAMEAWEKLKALLPAADRGKIEGAMQELDFTGALYQLRRLGDFLLGTGATG